MRVFITLFSLFATIILTCTYGAFAAQHVAPISQYGQIPNVQNYSSNPLWNPNGPYNQTFPRPVYVDGPDLNSGDCERTVSALVASFCAVNNNCNGMQLSDIRPSIMLQLSRLPGHNWATQCMGYIDSAFDQYIKTAQNHVPTNPVSFPQGTVPSNTQSGEFKIKNPFAPQIPDWAAGMQERKQELKQLQSQTSNYDTSVSYSRFPKTYYDLSFAERMQIEQDGYKVYEGHDPYQPITIEKPKVVNTNISYSNVTNANNSGLVADNVNSGADAGNTNDDTVRVDNTTTNHVENPDVDTNRRVENSVAANNNSAVRPDTGNVFVNNVSEANTECRPFAVNYSMLNNIQNNSVINLNSEMLQVPSNPYSWTNDPDNVPAGNTQTEKCLNTVWRTVLHQVADSTPQNCPVLSESSCNASCMPISIAEQVFNSVNNVYSTDANCLAVRTTLNGQCYIGVIPYGGTVNEHTWFGSMFAVRFGAVNNYVFNTCSNLLRSDIYMNIRI